MLQIGPVLYLEDFRKFPRVHEQNVRPDLDRSKADRPAFLNLGEYICEGTLRKLEKILSIGLD